MLAPTPNGFTHIEDRAILIISAKGGTISLVLGLLWGETSPATAPWDTIYADVILKAGAVLPVDPEAEQRPLYLISADIVVQADWFGEVQL